jgi:hypothetical protein
MQWREKLLVCVGAIGIACAVYLISNPYVPINYFRHREVLESNLGNSKAMYQPQLTPGGVANAAYLIAAGTSPLLAITGAIGAVALGLRAVRVRTSSEPAEIRRRATGLLLAVPAICVLGQCILVATDKPGEFGRFMLLPDIFLMIEAVVALGTLGLAPSHPYSGERGSEYAPSPLRRLARHHDRHPRPPLSRRLCPRLPRGHIAASAS